MKKSLLLIVALLLATITAWAEENTTFPLTSGQTWTNTTSNTTYTVSGESGNCTLTVSVADANKNNGTGYIADQAFYNKKLGDVKTIVIDAGITSIGEYALKVYPKSYNTVIFEANSQLETIKKGAFYDMSSITSINLGDCKMLKTIGSDAFRACKGLTFLDLSQCSNLTQIDDQAFFNCTSLYITIPKGVTLGWDVFDGVASVTVVGVDLEGLTFNETDGCYDIGSITEWQAFQTYANDVSGTSICQGLTFRLTGDIDLGGEAYTPISAFKGTLDGNGYTITGLSGSNGLFAFVSIGGTVKSLTVSDVDISGGEKVGAIASISTGVIEDCHVTGTISGINYVGGIVGYEHLNSLTATNNPHVSGCTFSGIVTGTGSFVGGIVGMTSRQIQNCTVTTSTLTGDIDVGGIAGCMANADAANYDISGCTIAGVSVNVAEGNESHKGKVCGYVDQDITTDPAVIATYIHDNNIYYSLTCGEGITATYVSGDKANYGGTDYYKTGTTFTIGHTNRDGYFWNGWEANCSGFISGVTLIIQDADVVLLGQWTLKQYSIAYDLAGGEVATANPVSYTVESEDITLVNPTRPRYIFAGWTGTDLEKPTITVTIVSGSTGDREYTATWAPITETVSYIDENRETQSHEAIVLTGDETWLGEDEQESWYVAKDTLNYTETLNIAGDVHLILANGAVMNIASEASPVSGIGIDGSEYYSDLTIYGQTLNDDTAGHLNINTDEECIYVAGDYAQHSGNVTANSSNSSAVVPWYNFTFTGGTLYVTAKTNAIYPVDNVDILGGKLSAVSVGNYWGINSTRGVVTFGWKSLDDEYTVSSFAAWVKIADGQAFTDGENIYDSSTPKEVFLALTNVTLRPVATFAISLPTSFEHGTVTCDKQTAAQGQTVTLTVTPDNGYKLETLTVTIVDANTSDGAPMRLRGGTVELTEGENGTYTFQMPAQPVTVNATFKKKVPTAIEEINADSRSGQRYNLMGQPVGKDYRGIVIEDGRKIIVK